MAINLDHAGIANVTLKSAAATLDIDTSIIVSGNVTATTFIGNLNGTADKVANTIIFNSSGAGDTSGISYDGSAARIISYNTVGAASSSGAGATGTWAINISGSAATLTTSRSISITGDGTWTVNFNGSANVTAALTLATVNASPVSDSFRKVTVNGKGLVTATSAIGSSDITTALGYTPANLTGATFTGPITVPSLNVDTNTNLDSANATSTNTTQLVLATFPIASYGSGEFLIQGTQGTARQITKVLVVHDSTTAIATEYAVLITGARLFTVQVDILSSNVRVLITPLSSISTVYKTFSTLMSA